MKELLSLIANSFFLAIVFGIPLLGFMRGVKVYDVFVEGAREGIDVGLKIVPYLVAMLVGIGMLRASGFFDLFARGLAPVFHILGIPKSVLPLMLMRPFSGSASNAILIDVIKQYGPDSFDAHLAATMMGSTETTFYVVAVYFGAVGVKNTRYAVQAGLLADVAGFVASVLVCRWLFLA
jgi:spore maturation protein B